MADPPQLDGRRARAIRREIADLAPYYTDDWDAGAGGVGAGLVDVFGELGAEVTERLDAAPAKHRVAFFEALGFAARPPQAARVPVQYTLAPEAPRNVAVRPGTAAIAAAGEEVAFHVGGADAFEATPARLTDVVSVHPDRDAIFDHGDVIDGGATATPWSGDDLQAHEWYLGDADLLTAGQGDAIVVDVDTDADPAVLENVVEWHYYGKASADGPEDWQRIADPVLDPEPQGDVAVRLTPEGALVEYEVDGVESKWLRCRLPPGTAPAGDLTFEVRTVGITTSASGEGHPDELLANDVPQENPAEDDPIRPFGDRPRPGDTFYVGAATALSKAGASVTLTFTPTDGDGEGARTDGGRNIDAGVFGNASVEDVQLPEEVVEQIQEMMNAGADPSLSWEYWDGDGWSRIPDLTDGTERFTATEPETVTFEVPDDLAPTTVAGHDGHWIRVRLVGGSYGDVTHVPLSSQETRWVRQTTGRPPAFSEITVSYEVRDRQPPGHVRTHNALAATERAPEETYRPFTPLAESEQTLYFGFDKPLSGGPLQLFAAVEEHPYPEGFTPRLRWERRRATDAGWTRLDVQDDTAGLTEQGIVGMAVAEPTRATSRFGRERHWIRARVTGDEFEPEEEGETEASHSLGRVARREIASLRSVTGTVSNQLLGLGRQRIADGGSRALSPCGTTVETAPPGGTPTKTPPLVTGLHMNTGWARNVRTIEDELLGGSDGERDQTFAVGSPPAVDAEVWVDELAALSEPQRETLASERPDDVEVERTTDGGVRAVWVRWQEVPDLLDSGSDARHFVVDATDGEVRFGDGARGRIPPRGANNVRASYRTGGGAAGNVPAGAVEELKSGLPFVEAVTNPAPGAGGADTESTAEVLERAPQTLRDRDRAVMPADYERLAADASRRVERARCIPAMDEGGDYDPGYVTVLVVPQASGETPVPSLGLLDRVEASLSNHAPASVVAGEQLVVRGPSYVAVGVDADVVAGAVGSLNAVEERLQDVLADFLHPLSGRDGEGWDFGELPTRSDVFALLEGVDGVDHVASLFLSFTGQETITVGEGEPQPSASGDALVRGGDHDLTVSPGGGG